MSEGIKISGRLDPNMLEWVRVERADPNSNVVTFSSRRNGVRKTQQMLAVNKIGIYEALFASHLLIAYLSFIF